MKTILALLMLTASVQATDWLPGIMAVDVYGNCEEQGFTTAKEHTSTRSTYVSTKTLGGLTMMAETTCLRSVSKVSQVVATIGPVNDSDLNSGNLGPLFLSWLAGLKIEGSKPDVARKWVLDHLHKGGAFVHDGVYWDLIVDGKSRSLRISVVPLH